jgi:hypothetical protein
MRVVACGKLGGRGVSHMRGQMAVARLGGSFLVRDLGMGNAVAVLALVWRAQTRQ